jgi:hypothetical protein
VITVTVSGVSPDSARTALPPLSTYHFAHAIHMCAQTRHAGLPRGSRSRGEMRPNRANDFREMDDSTRCGQARNPEETREVFK